MGKALIKYEPNAAGGIVIILIIAVIIYFLTKNRQVGTYKNEEAWDVSYNADGMPTKIVIHRNAIRG